MARSQRGIDRLRRLGRAGRVPGRADALAHLRLALLAHVARPPLAAADHERYLGLLAAQLLERLADLRCARASPARR